MWGILWSDTGDWFWFQLALTILSAVAAWSTGRALATTWGPAWLLAPYMAVLAAAVRFLHFALFQEELSSLYYYAATFVLMLAVAFGSYRSMRATQMATQYSWSYEKNGLNWRDRSAG
jgi:hypothetical protein